MDPCPIGEEILGKYKGVLDNKYNIYQTIGKGQYAKYS